MTLQPGANLLHYRIVAKLGEGGMGVVWKALDTTLDRSVALKVLPASFGEDIERLARFEREARSLAALNHPNVASVFGLHEADGTRFLAMEFVEGEDLAQRIARGPLPPDEAVRIAIGIAEALTAAHAQGIVHRDLKPANVMLDSEGVPKVLDFGLAKTAGPDGTGSASGDPSASPTITSLGTVAGALLGTAAYMSPEQARGKPVDKRADTWALGCILFEMLSGQTLFKGETVSDTLASVLKSEPDWDALPRSTPPSLVRILRRSLAKQTRDRWQDAGDLRYELERSLESPADVSSEASGKPYKLVPLVAGALVVGLILGAALRQLTIAPPAGDGTPRGRTVSDIASTKGIVFSAKSVDLALSPDGSDLAYVGVDPDGVRRLYVRSLTSGGTKELPGTENAREPFWSPDGTQVAFHTGVAIQRIGLNDPQPRLVTESTGAGGSWHENGTMLFCLQDNGPVQVVDVETGRIRTLPQTSLDQGGCDGVWTLPDGKHFLFEAYQSGRDGYGIYRGSLDSTEVERLVDLKSNASYSAGHLLFHDGPQLLAQRLDPQTFDLAGEPLAVASPVFELNFPFHCIFTAARDRPRVVYLEGTGESLQTELVWFDRNGEIVERTGIVGDLYNPELSKDTRRLLLDVSTYETEGDIWLFDLARGSSRRLTDHPQDESRPVWSLDERTVFFFRVPDLYRIDLGGDEQPVVFHESEHFKSTSDISRDGVVAFTESVQSNWDIRYYDTATGEVASWLATEATEAEPAFSPDGQWLAYQSDDSGRLEIYIDRFPVRGERFQVSRNGGTNPSWRADGKELYYVSLTNEIVAVPVDLESDGRPIGAPQVLFQPKIRRDMYTPHPSGERFLVVTRLDPEIDRAILVDDWDSP